MAERIQVVADDRERPSGIPGLLAAQTDVDLRVERLPVGDYLVDDSVVIERKTAVDFAQSIVDGRLFAQASRLASGQRRPAIIIVGTGREWAGLGVPRHALQGALITLMLIFDIPVFRALDADEAARLIVYVGRQLARLRNPDLAICRPAKAKRKRTRQLRLLQNLPGIGPKRAGALLEHFVTVRACLDASGADLEQVTGIGRGTAQAIVSTVNETRADYTTHAADAGDAFPV
jgi:DNA excision repair protein ERCC-4